MVTKRKIMGLYQLFTKAEKGDTFRISDNPQKYADASFQENMAANSNKPTNAIKMPPTRLAATNAAIKANTTIPGSK